MDSLHSIFYLNRLKSLQALCKSEETPLSALVFIPGPDGRNNPMAVRVLKYLFKGSVGTDLFDDTLDQSMEQLEDVVLVVQPESVCIIASDEMKASITNQLAIFPRVIEYRYSKSEEEDIDQFQLKKCIFFKKMMLEISQGGANIGISVPVGYDSVMDIEGWPLLQAFAMDEVLCSTGFYTARYNVVDITTQLETLFRTVDCFYVENATSLANAAIREHMIQFLGGLDTTTVNQRDRITAEEAISPLEILYEFGEMEAAIPLEQSLKPVLLFGPFSNFIGNAIGPKAAKWKEFYPANSLHAVVESSEPATGLRWCRTYFLQQGTSSYIYDEVLKLQSSLAGINLQAESEEEANEAIEESLRELKKLSSSTQSHVPSAASLASLQRLMTLYVKLWFNLRTVVCETFLTENDVLDAGNLIQKRLGDAMNLASGESKQSDNSSSLGSSLQEINLFPHEKLQLHMDCVNALGEIVGVDDVDDMGGVCWTYIRASIHGIKVPQGNQETTVTVAVGDTFLFAPFSAAKFNGRATDWRFSSGNLLPFLYDPICVTHSVPYFQAMLGPGLEEDYLRLVNYCAKTSITSSPLNLGKPIEIAGTNSTNVFAFTNHSVHPFFTSDLKLYQEGFILTKLNHLSSVPITVHFARDISKVWTIDSFDCFQEAIQHIQQSSGNSSSSSSSLTAAALQLYGQSEDRLPKGIILIFELKSRGIIHHQQHTALHQSLPSIFTNSKHSQSQTQFLAIFFPHNDRSGSILPSIMESWKVSIRMNDIEEFKGKSHYGSISKEILFNYLVFLDSLKLFYNDERSKSAKNIANNKKNQKGAEGKESEDNADDNEELIVPLEFDKILRFVDEFNTIGYPIYGFYSMKCFHSIAESRRLSKFSSQFSTILFGEKSDEDDEEQEGEAKKSFNDHKNKVTKKAIVIDENIELIVLNGLTGTGISILSQQLIQQLSSSMELSLSRQNIGLEFIHLDFNQFLFDQHQPHSKDANSLIKALKSFISTQFASIISKLNRKNKKNVLFTIITNNPILNLPFQQLLQLLHLTLNSRIVHVTNVINAENVHWPFPLASGSVASSTSAGVGKEFWNAFALEGLHPFASQNVIVLQSNTQSTYYQQLKNYLEIQQNNSLNIMKLSSFNIYFEEEDIQYFQQIILSPASNNNTGVWTDAQVAYGFPVFEDLLQISEKDEEEVLRQLSCPLTIDNFSSVKDYSFLQTWRFSSKELFAAHLSSSREYFSLTIFLKLLAAIFPQAMLMNKTIFYDWNHLNNSNKNNSMASSRNNPNYHRLLEYAMKKVFQQNELKEMVSHYQTTSKTLLAQLAPHFANVISLQAILVLDNERISPVNATSSSSSSSPRRVLIEANQGNIIYRELSSSSSPFPENSEIIVTGLLPAAKEVQSSFLSLFQLAQQYYLKPKELLKKEEFLVAPEDLARSNATTLHGKHYQMAKVLKLQGMSIYATRPLPSGHWFDGSFFIDHNGQRFELRPDVEEIIDDFVSRENRKRLQYNRWLEDLYL